NDPQKKSRELRYSLERLHGEQSPYTVDLAWPHLSNVDRTIRFTARVAIEHQPVASWAGRALAETNPVASIQAIIALARCGDSSMHDRAIESLNRIDWTKLNDSQRLDLL